MARRREARLRKPTPCVARRGKARWRAATHSKPRQRFSLKGLVIMQREVEVGSLVIEIPNIWVNPRSFTGLGKVPIGELAEDIKHRGVKDPLTVQRVRVSGRDDVIELVLDGQRRGVSLPKAGYSKSD